MSRSSSAMPTACRQGAARGTLLAVAALALTSCGGGSNGPAPMPHTVGGTVSGLTGSGFALLDNGNDSLSVSGNGTFTFAKSVLDGTAYAVTVGTEPTNPTQTCTVAHGSGTVSGSDITNVAISCTTNSYTVGGTVSGLSGSGLVLTNNSGDNLPVTKPGPFVFTNAVASGSVYSVAVATQPINPPQTCVVANGSGTIQASNITTVSVTCTTNTYTVGGYVSGLVGSGLTLNYNGGAPVAISRNGAFASATGVAIGSPYSVAIAGQPTNPAQTCVLSNGNGTVGTVNVTSISVFCPQAVGRFAYVLSAVNASSNVDISVYTIDPGTGALALVPGSTVATDANVRSFQLVPHSRFGWALIGSNGTIYDYAVDPNTGLLTGAAGNPYSNLDGTSSTPSAGCGGSGLGTTIAVTLSPGGAFGYVENAGPNPGYWRFTVDPMSGVPNLVAGSNIVEPGVCLSGGPVTIDPSGQYAYIEVPVLGALTLGIDAFKIDASGALTLVPGGPFDGGVTAQILAIDPTGRFAYICRSCDHSGADIEDAAIDFFSGALSSTPNGLLVPNSEFSTVYVAVEPRGRFAYVTISKWTNLAIDSSRISTFSIDPSTGAVSTTPSSSVTLGLPTAPASPLQIDPSGQFAYTTATVTAGQTGVYAFTINASTGALTPVPGSPFAVGAPPGNPIAITITN